MARQGEHAVVIGASMAGLTAARVLADHFARVTVLERDRLPIGAGQRRGVPQARHLHVLLVRGRTILETLFPGLESDLLAAGAHPIDMGADLAWLTPAGWGVRFASGLELLPVSRELLEWRVREHLRGCPRVELRDGWDVTGLLTDATSATRLRLRSATSRGSDEEVLTADLIVHASGRGSKAPAWLEATGFPAPAETMVNTFAGYASRVYRRPTALTGSVKGIHVQSAPPTFTRGGALYPLEGDRCLLTLIGLGRDYPPLEEDGFLAFAGSLRSPMIAEAIQEAQPLSGIAGSRATQSRMRHYERLARQPERFLLLGDAVCVFNPVYGQGMTTAALAAMELDSTLMEQATRRPAGDLDGLAGRFQRRLAKVNRAPWILATGADLRVVGAEGPQARGLARLIHRQLARVLPLTTTNPAARQTLLEIVHMVRSPAALFHPHILALQTGAGIRRTSHRSSDRG